MAIDWMRRLWMFIILLLVQVLILGGVHLFNCATPLVYVWFVTLFPRNYPKWVILVTSFALGLAIDVCYNTPGLAASTMTLMAVIQPYYFELFIPRDSADNVEPTMKLLGAGKYAFYLGVMVTLYCLVFFTLEMFSFFNLMHWVLCIVGSSLLTTMLLITFETARENYRIL